MCYDGSGAMPEWATDKCGRARTPGERCFSNVIHTPPSTLKRHVKRVRGHFRVFHQIGIVVVVVCHRRWYALCIGLPFHSLTLPNESHPSRPCIVPPRGTWSRPRRRRRHCRFCSCCCRSYYSESSSASSPPPPASVVDMEPDTSRISWMLLLTLGKVTDVVTFVADGASSSMLSVKVDVLVAAPLVAVTVMGMVLTSSAVVTG